MTSAIVVGGGIVGIACARELARAGVRVQVFHDGPLAAGLHLFTLDALPAGVYVARALGGGTRATRRFTLVR